MRQALTSLNEMVGNEISGGSSSLGGALGEFFNSWQTLSNNPASIPERQVVLQKAQTLASRLNETDARLGMIEDGINESLGAGVKQVNSLLRDIARLNEAIIVQEGTTQSNANTLRDTRQTKLEELSKLIRIDTAEQPNGGLNVMAGGRLLVEGPAAVAELESFDPGDGRMMVGIAGEGVPLNTGGGSLHGKVQFRDGDLAALRGNLHGIASLLISEVNALHAPGFSLTGSTGANFFNGTDASDIQVNMDLLSNPALLQGSGESGAAGNNQVFLGLAQLASKKHPSLNGATFSQRHLQTVAWLGQEAANNTSALRDQQVVRDFLGRQRSSISGVSVDEEMSNLVMFQKAFQASAKLVSMTDEMLATLIAM